MKHLLLTLVFSTSLTAFSQVQVTTLPGHGDNILQHAELRATQNAICHHNTLTCRCGSGEVVTRDIAKPDTLRATLLVSFPGGKVKRIPFTMPGFVVRVLKTAVGSVRDYELLYLDDNKKQIKAPLKVFSYVKD